MPQPMPVDCAVAYSERDGQTETSIARLWKPGATARCRLCPLGHCTAGAGNMCLVVVKARVPERDAWLFKARRMDPALPPLPDDPRLTAGPTANERRIIAAIRVMGLSFGESLRRLENEADAGWDPPPPPAKPCCDDGRCRRIDRIRRILGFDA
jgi:hypothetical protein